MPAVQRIIAAVAALLFSAPVLAAPALWEVRDHDSSIWVFGSFHILPAGTEWRTKLFDRIIDDADRVIFEADISAAATMEIGAKAFAMGIYVDGTLLTDVIDEGTEAMLRKHTSAIGVPVGSVLAMRPWLAANTISVAAMAAEGFGTQGVEYELQGQLAADKMGYLETGDEQLDVLAGAPEDEQVAMLVSILNEMDVLPKVIGKMLHNWTNGTPETLAGLFLSEMGGFEDAFMDRLIFARNRNWIAPLEAMLDANERTLVIVGAAHLIGEQSVLDLLERRGYSVTRIQ